MGASLPPLLAAAAEAARRAPKAYAPHAQTMRDFLSRGLLTCKTLPLPVDVSKSRNCAPQSRETFASVASTPRRKPLRAVVYAIPQPQPHQLA